MESKVEVLQKRIDKIKRIQAIIKPFNTAATVLLFISLPIVLFDFEFRLQALEKHKLSPITDYESRLKYLQYEHDLLEDKLNKIETSHDKELLAGTPWKLN